MSEAPEQSPAGMPAPTADALAGRVVLVVGAHGGLGSEIARGAAAAGATVVLLGRRVPKLSRVYDAILAAGGAEPAIYPLDLEGASPAEYAEMAERIGAECGRLDAVVHAAADFPGLTPFKITEPEDWLRALHVNLSAPLLLTRACLPLLEAAPDAAVLFVHEDLPQVARAYWGGYGVAKHGLVGLQAILADELADTRVRVHGVRPGPMRGSLRGRAWFGEDPGKWPGPDRYAPACVALLGPAGIPHRGTTLDLAETSS